MKKTILTKILIFTFIFTILLTILVVPCFADSSNGIFVPGESFTFAIDFSEYSPDLGYLPLYFYCIIDGAVVHFESIEFIADLYGAFELSYKPIDGDDFYVFQDGEWLNEGYRTIIFEEYTNLNFYNTQEANDYITFFYLNEDVYADEGIFNSLFDIISSTFFGNQSLTSEQNLCVTLLCLVLCVVIVALPIVIVYGICIALSRIGVRFI